MQLTQSSPTKTLPVEITSYDLLKTFAVIIMVIDHIGFYLYPDDLWFRAIGRIGFPVWFFLIGYARGRDLPLKLWLGIGALILGDLVAGRELFPLNALVTIALIRVLIDPFMETMLKSKVHLWGVSIVLILIVIPSGLACEYGTLGLITAIFGYLVRNKDEIETITNGRFGPRDVTYYMLFALFAFVSIQQLSFMFTTEQFLFMAIGTAVVRIFLLYFDMATYPRLTKAVGVIPRYFIQICGRRTLEIYVVHLLILKFVAAGYLTVLAF